MHVARCAEKIFLANEIVKIGGLDSFNELS